MSGLLSRIVGTPKSPSLAGFHIQTASYGNPIPIVYGTTRVAGNVIHMPKQPTLKDGNQGKGSRSSKGASGGENYIAPIVIGLCEGPISLVPDGGIWDVWRDKDGKLTFVGNYDVAGWGFKIGVINPTPWTYLSSNYPSEAIGYQFTAYAMNAAVPLPSGSLSQYSWEIQGFLRFSPGANNTGIIDASPADIVPDLLTSAQYGAGFANAQLGSLTQFQDYCAAASLFCSPAIDTQQPGADWINEITEVGNTGLVWSDGVVKFVPYGDVPLTGNGHTYTPDTTPVYDLTDDDFIASAGADPIQVTRTDPSTAFNQVTVEYRDRDHDYNVTTYTATDQLAVSLYGLVPMATLQLHSIATSAVAQQVAQLRLQREQFVRNKYAFRIGWKFSLLEPMDLVTLTDVGLGLALTPVRITAIDEDDSDGTFAVTAEDWPFGVASATLYPRQAPSGSKPDANVDPGNTNTPIIVEGPTALIQAPMELWIGASGGANWGGCDVWASTDGVSFTKVGRIIGAAAYGALTATLATSTAYPNTDGANTLSVNIASTGRTLASITATSFNNLEPLCYVEGAAAATPEWLAYENAALTSLGHYDLTTMYRGLYGSTVASHGGGKAFLFVDNSVIRIPWPNGKPGQTVTLKLPAFNLYGGALQDVSSVGAFSYVIGGSPIPRAVGVSQGTVSVATNGDASWTADLPNNALSLRWAFSTSAYPADATVAASGTIISLAGLHSASATSFTTLTFGQHVFVTVVPFTGSGALGVALQAAHFQGAYLNTVATKFDTYVGSGFGLRDPTLAGVVADTLTGRFVGSAGINPTKAQAALSIKISNAVVVTSLDLYGKLNFSGAGTERLAVSFDEYDKASGAGSNVGQVETNSASSAVQLVTQGGLAHAIDSQNKTYQLSTLLADSSATATALELWSVTIGYTSGTIVQNT